MPDNHEIASAIEALSVTIQASAAATQSAVAALTAKVETVGATASAQSEKVGRLEERLANSQRETAEAKALAHEVASKCEKLKEKQDRWAGALSILVIILGLVEAALEISHRAGHP